jgi:hypothetical protein
MNDVGEVVHAGIDIVILAEPTVEFRLDTMEDAAVLFRKEMPVEKSSLGSSVKIALPK